MGGQGMRPAPAVVLLGLHLLIPLSQMNQEASLPFKSFVPYMVLNLEDADGTVRDTAKSSLIDLFKCVKTLTPSCPLTWHAY